MKVHSLFLLVLGMLLTQSSHADLLTPTDVVRVAGQFGLPKVERLTGLDHRGRKCELYYGADERHLSVSGTVYVTANGVETAGFDAFVGSAANEKVIELQMTGSAQKDGTFKAKIREHVPAHKTDFGMPVPAYDVDSSVELIFKSGRLVNATVKTGRPGLSNLVFDPDYRGGEVKGCQFP